MPENRSATQTRRAPQVILRLLLVVLGFFMAVPMPADVTDLGSDKKKKKKKEPDPALLIPEVRDLAGTFLSGQQITIELTASVGTLKQVEFIIRQQPTSGTLSAIRPHPRETNKAIVTYTHRGGNAPLTDRFSYAARVDGGPISAPAFVMLTGERPEPRLELVEYFAVDKIFLGGESTVRFTLKNSGAADFAADLAWEEPWKGPERIDLKAGESRKFSVIFHPAKTGIYRLEKIIQPGVPGGRLPLYAECVAALTVSPGRLVLTGSSTGAREGELILHNSHAEALRARVQTDERLKGGGEIEVPGGDTRRIRLSLDPQDVAAYIGEVAIETPMGNEKVVVESGAMPAILKIVSQGGNQLDLGSHPVGKTVTATVVIRNTGGTAAVIQPQPRRPLTVQPEGRAVRLEPGAEATFTVSMKSEHPGLTTGELAFSSDASAPRITLQMDAKAPDMPEPPQPEIIRPGLLPSSQVGRPSGTPALNAPLEKTRELQLLMAYFASSGIPVPKDRINPGLPRVTDLELLERNTHSLKFAWQKPPILPANWLIETSSIVHSNKVAGNFVKVWNPLKNWKLVDENSSRITVLVESLPALAPLEIRIMGMDRDGKVSEPSPLFTLTTADTWRIPSWTWYGLVIASLSIVIYFLNRIRKGDWRQDVAQDSKAVAS